jgi:hypothetical protein
VKSRVGNKNEISVARPNGRTADCAKGTTGFKSNFTRGTLNQGDQKSRRKDRPKRSPTYVLSKLMYAKIVPWKKVCNWRKFAHSGHPALNNNTINVRQLFENENLLNIT